MRVGAGCLILTIFAVFHSVHVFESVLGVLIYYSMATSTQ